MSAKTNDTLYLAIGGAVLLGAGVWAFVQQSTIEGFRAAPNVPASGSPYEAAPLSVTTPESRRWAVAPAQPAGDKWIYDVFTPPEIYYNTQTKQFTVVPPKIGPDTPEPPKPVAPFGLELVKVEQPLFRLQLVGYVGEGAQARGNFLVVDTGNVVFGTTGKKFADLNLEVVRFSAERRRQTTAGGTELVWVEAKALVRDTVTGVETALDSQTRVPAGAPAATFKLADGTERQARAGETITVGDQTFKVGELVLTPPSAVVTKEAPDLEAPKTETLVIPPPAPAPAAPEEAPPGIPPGYQGPPPMGAPATGVPPAFPGF